MGSGHGLPSHSAGPVARSPVQAAFCEKDALMCGFCTPGFVMASVGLLEKHPSATPDQIAQITAAFRGLRDRIPGITGFEHGVNDSPEHKNLGFTHVYMLTFTSAQARDAYLPHPEHKKFGDLLTTLGVLEDAFVVDYADGRP